MNRNFIYIRTTMHTYLMIPTFDFVFENKFDFLNYCNYVLECAFMAPIQI